MCSLISICFHSLIATIALIYSSGAVPVTSNSTFQEQPTALKYKPVNATSYRMVYDVLFTLDQAEIYIRVPPYHSFPSYTISDSLEKLRLSVQTIHCEFFERVYGYNVSEIVASRIEQALGVAPGKNAFSNDDFESAIVDTDNDSFFAAVVSSNDDENLGLLFVAKKEVTPQMDELRRNRILELTRELNFSPGPWIVTVVSNRRDCKNLQSGNSEDAEGVEDNEDVDDSEEVQLNKLLFKVSQATRL